MARTGRSHVEHYVEHHRNPRPARPPILLPALFAGCALFAVAAWARVGAGGRLLYNEVDGDAIPGSPPMHRPLSLAVEATALSTSPYAKAAALAPCTLTRPTPRRLDEPRIAVAITTSRRSLLFRRAMLSFRTLCLDCLSRVDEWFAVDDGSTPEELADMRLYPA